MSGKGKDVDERALAVHLSTEQGTGHVVGIGNIRVLINKEGNFWYAQGLEIDYVAQGKTIEDVKKAFEDGLTATIHENIRVHGTIEPVLKVAPQNIWEEVLNPNVISNKFTQVSVHQIEAMKSISLDLLPFQGIEYLQREEAA